MKILIVGGAGYIGSVVTETLVINNEVIVYDDLSTGFRTSVHNRARFIKGSILNKRKILRVMAKHKPELVIHLAAKIVVPESTVDPLGYYKTNVDGTINVLEAMKKNNIKNIIFSSSAAVYGEPKKVPLLENDPKCPCNPYGETKLICEMLLESTRKAVGINYVAFRFFNVAGASTSGRFGACKTKPTLLIPTMNKAIIEERSMNVFGNDYETKDGSCLRDYIHVEDLARAHVNAINYLSSGKSGIFNLGSNMGYTVLEVIKSAEASLNVRVNYEISARRPGDPASLITSNEHALKELNWKPAFSLKEMIISDYNFQIKKRAA